MSATFIITSIGNNDVSKSPGGLTGVPWDAVIFGDSATQTISGLVAAGFATVSESVALAAAASRGNKVHRYTANPSGLNRRGEDVTICDLNVAGWPLLDQAFRNMLIVALADTKVRAAIVAANSGGPAPASGIFG